MITEKAYKTFLSGALLSALITLGVKVFAPGLTFNISIMETEIQSSYVYAWLLFTFYLSLLAGLYLIANKWKLTTRRWLVISHYTFVMMLLFLFFIFSVFDSPQFQTLISRINVPLVSVISIYAALLIIDIVLFLGGIILLLVNMFFLHKSGRKS